MGFFGVSGHWRGPGYAPQELAAAVAAGRAGLPVLCDNMAAAHPHLLAGPAIASSGGVSVLVHGRPAWRDTFGVWRVPEDAATSILEAYLRDAVGLLAKLGGNFALALVDGGSSRTLLAIDAMGIGRMTWAVRGEAIVFGDSAAVVAGFPAVRTGLSAQALHNYLLLHVVPSPDTVYEGVSKLEPGTSLHFQDGRVEVRRYWHPKFATGASDCGHDLESEVRAGLEAAVRRCAPDEATGAFLSGGLDSSTVAGILGRVTGRPARTFSMGFGVESHDELEYARITNAHFGCKPTEHHVTADEIVASFHRVAAAYDEPFGNSSAVPTLICAQVAAENGVRHLLAGDGGDELFGGNERYAKQRLFEAWWRLPGWLRDGVLVPLSCRVPPDSSLMPLRKFRSYVEQARIPIPERLETWNHVYRTPVEDLLEPEFLHSVDPRQPFKRMATVFEEAGSTALLDRMLYYDWHYTLADNDLRKVGTMCELAGLRVSYPMLDSEVIEIALRVPAGLKMRGSDLRSFYKGAMAGFLPQRVLAKEKHGFGLPFGVWLKDHAQLRELVFGLLQDLSRRRIVRRSYVESLVAGHTTGDANYFGYPIWDLAMLEAWLQAHTPS